MTTYRKKPVSIEAFQMTRERRMDNSEWPAWLSLAWNCERNTVGALQRVDMKADLPDYLEIVTLEGKMVVSWGDWIIRGVKGEIYPCKPDIFAETYEPVSSAGIGDLGIVRGDDGAHVPPPIRYLLSQAEADALAERRGQRTREGFTSQRDDRYTAGELAWAAICYAKASRLGAHDCDATRWWPFSFTWWKPATPRRMLIKAIALLLAEVDRLDRKEVRK